MLNTLQKVSLASKTKKPFLLHTLNTYRNLKNISSEAENISNLPEDGPTFSHYVNEFLLKDGIRKSNEINKDDRLILDMTFGTGKNCTKILNRASSLNVPVKIVASTLNSSEYQRSKDMPFEDSRLTFLPTKSTFSSLPTDLIDAGFNTKSFDGIIIDTSSKINQLQNKNMYLYKTKLDKLDLRDESTDSEVNLPSASDVLQHIGEKELYKLLKYYGQLGSWSKHIVEKIVEARYMFHRFETISELSDILSQASQSIISSKSADISYMKNRIESFYQRNNLHPPENDDAGLNSGYNLEERLTHILLNQTLSALRIIVNDEINELDFALRYVAPEFLKPTSGTLVTILHSISEEKVAKSIFNEAQATGTASVKEQLDKEELINLSKRNWTIVDCSNSQQSHRNKSNEHTIHWPMTFVSNYIE